MQPKNNSVMWQLPHQVMKNLKKKKRNKYQRLDL